jgi:hypothetical protein
MDSRGKTEMSKAIRKNANRQIKQIADTVIEVKSYTLDNNFEGKQLQNFGPVECFALMSRALQDGASLRHHSEMDRYTLQLHSNHWYEIKCKAVRV